MGQLATLESELGKYAAMEYANKKKSWLLAFFLGLLFGPFGFFYTSWKTAAIWIILAPIISLIIGIYFSKVFDVKELGTSIFVLGLAFPWIFASPINAINARRVNKRILIELLNKHKPTPQL